VLWKKFRPISLLALSLLAAHAFATAVLPDGSYPLTVIGSAFPIFCGLLMIIPSWINSRGAKGAVRMFWLLLAASFALQLLSQMYFGYFEVILRKDVSGPWGDCLFFLLAVPLLAALSICPQTESVSSRLRFRYLDLVILLLWWLCLYSYFALPWSSLIDDAAKFSSANNALLMVEDSVVLSILAFYGWKTHGAWKRFYAQFFAAFLFFAAGGYLQNFVGTLNLYHSGGWFDFPLNIGFVWFVILTESAGALSAEAGESVQKRSSPGLWSARLTMLAMLSLPVLAAVGSLSSSVPSAVTDFRLQLICIAILVLGFVVFVRLHLSAREIARLVKMTRSSVQALKSVQARIAQSQKMVALGRLAAGATHEINNPLTAVMGYAELLHEDSTLSAEEVRSANKIKEEVRRAQVAILRFRQVAATVEAETNPNAPAERIG
jgi:phospho-acceptor domain-containing protein